MPSPRRTRCRHKRFDRRSASTVPAWSPRGWRPKAIRPPLQDSSWRSSRSRSTVRTTMRRYTRLSNGFSRKIENHAAAVALNYFAYNFVRIHRTLRVSPAMAVDVTDRLFEVSDLVALLEAEEREAKRAA